MVVMGIDPGVAHTGFGVVRVAGGRMTAIDGGVIEAPASESVGERLVRIHDSLSELIGWHEPVAVALEDLYFGRNVRSAIAVGQARGVAVLAAAQHGVPTHDYTPQAVKMSVCGSGAAVKAQVQQMVGALLGLAAPPKSDHAADALAVAICHASHTRPAHSLAPMGRESEGAVALDSLAGEAL
ncbi:MAG: crossover junction endodeoxyribonuclease RuvC [Solirubrobacterales bacterium]